MVGDSPYQAIVSVLQTLRQVLSCVTLDVLQVSGYAPDVTLSTSFSGGRSARLNRSAFSLNVWHRLDVVAEPGHWRVAHGGYQYTLESSAAYEVLAYHWHPAGLSPITEPHFHLGPDSAAIDLLTSAHLPTGHISLADVVRLLIRDLGVPPRRADWQQVLATAELELQS